MSQDPVQPGSGQEEAEAKSGGKMNNPKIGQPKAAQIILPGFAERLASSPAGLGARPVGEALQILLEMYNIIEQQTGESSRACFNLLVRFLGDCLRIYPLPKQDHPVGRRLLPLAIPYFSACVQDPWDWLGEVFEIKACGNPRLGQHFTPRSVVRFMVELVLGAPSALSPGETHTVLDPCTGTGRFLVDIATRYRHRGLALFGIELDLDLYRAALVNMRTYAMGLPYFILRADALLVDASLNSPNWQFANLWDPPDWRSQMVLLGEGPLHAGADGLKERGKANESLTA